MLGKDNYTHSASLGRQDNYKYVEVNNKCSSYSSNITLKVSVMTLQKITLLHYEWHRLPQILHPLNFMSSTEFRSTYNPLRKLVIANMVVQSREEKALGRSHYSPLVLKGIL